MSHDLRILAAEQAAARAEHASAVRFNAQVASLNLGNNKHFGVADNAEQLAAKAEVQSAARYENSMSAVRAEWYKPNVAAVRGKAGLFGNVRPANKESNDSGPAPSAGPVAGG